MRSFLGLGLPLACLICLFLGCDGLSHVSKSQEGTLKAGTQDDGVALMKKDKGFAQQTKEVVHEITTARRTWAEEAMEDKFKVWAQFWANVGSMFMIKIIAGIDDVFWAASVLNTNCRSYNIQAGLVYLGVAISVTAVSGIVSFLISQNLERFLTGGYWNAERLSAVVCGSLLILYSVKIYFDEDEEEEEEENEDQEVEKLVQKEELGEATIVFGALKQLSDGVENDAEDLLCGGNIVDQDVIIQNSPPRKSPVSEEVKDGMTKSAGEAEPASGEDTVDLKPKIALSTFATVAILGVTDDAVLFVCLTIGSSVTFMELIIGSALGSLCILLFCLALGYVRCCVELLAKIPFWSIVAILGIWVLTNGLFDMGI
mmetsp:Transcript_21198/g.34168  ORF Transcript_21198/g.34168 Transcript_21198/m.34168 type:complete len:372 (+) Transcript_21198:24-1139(+)